MTNLVPPGVYTQNCVPQHISVMSYSMMDPRYVDKTTYYLADGATFNPSYTPVNWKPRYTSGWYGPINEKAVIEIQGVKEAFYPTSQKLVFAYQGAVQRVSGIGSTWVSSPIWIDFDGKADADSIAQPLDLNNFARGGCAATPGEMLRGNFAEDRNMNFIPAASGGLVDSRSGHGDDTHASTTPITITTSGFLSPINPDGSSIFSTRDSIPVKIKVFINGQPVPDLTTLKFHAVWLNPDPNCTDNCAVDVTPTSKKGGGNTFRSENQGDQYIYTWNTNSLQTGQYIIFAVLDGQAIHSNTITLGS